MRVVVIGGGILGLAAAREALRRHPDTEIVLFDKEPDVGLHQTGHNSGVVHAGIYYAPGSLKARLCRRGVELLSAYCREGRLPYEECGKLVVATESAELPRLEELERRSLANGVPGIERLGPAQMREVEPHVKGVAALHSPSTAITDYGVVARAFRDELVERGVELRLGTPVVQVARSESGPVAVVADGSRVEADKILVCAGLQSDRLAVASGGSASPRIIPFRGEYWQLRPERTYLVQGLIYPVPDPELPFLGVHLTRHIGDSVLIGPNAVLAAARERYDGRGFDYRDVSDTLRWQGMWRLGARYWRVGAGELARSRSKRLFVHAARRFVPALAPDDVVPALAGVRAQAVDADGSMVDDFRIDEDGGVAWVRNAPSPAATSSMAIAEDLVDRLRLA